MVPIFGGQYGAAEQTFEKALALKQESVDNYYGLALSQAMQNKFDKARENLGRRSRCIPITRIPPRPGTHRQTAGLE